MEMVKKWSAIRKGNRKKYVRGGKGKHPPYL